MYACLCGVCLCVQMRHTYAMAGTWRWEDGFRVSSFFNQEVQEPSSGRQACVEGLLIAGPTHCPPGRTFFIGEYEDYMYLYLGECP